jgi:spermidine/putrescine ABC transporter ATP-binding subunit
LSQVVLEGVRKKYGDFTALQPTDLQIADGEFLTLLGPSGCGKTTTLRIIAGFVEPDAGRVIFDSQDVTMDPPQARSIGMVFQDYALFPHLTIADNIGFSLRERRVPKRQINARVEELLHLIKLPDIGKRYPSEISGGQQQRVAFARAIASTPRVLLMDEPLGALDLKLREAMQIELRSLQRKLGITTVYVTHDQSEAMNLSDRIAVMEKGHIVQLGSAREVYEKPRTRFVADFIGKINFLAGKLGGTGRERVIRNGSGAFHVPAEDATMDGQATLAVRPQQLGVVNGAGVPHDHNQISGVVLNQIFNGNLCHILVDVGEAQWVVEARPDDHRVEDGQRVTLHWHPNHAIVLVD